MGKFYRVIGPGGRTEFLDTAILASGTKDVKIPLSLVDAVYFSQNTASPVAEEFGWTFDKATKTLTIKSSNSSSTATVLFHAYGW